MRNLQQVNDNKAREMQRKLEEEKELKDKAEQQASLQSKEA